RGKKALSSYRKKLHACAVKRGLWQVLGFYEPQYFHIPPDLVVRGIIAHRKPPDVRICRLRNQSRVGTVPPSTSTPHCPACLARRWEGPRLERGAGRGRT